MRLTDLAIIFAAVLLPIVIIVYVNTSFVVRAEKEEMYYKNLITSAVTDATNAMKKVENDDNKIDYGYSGIVDNKVSINADVAVDTFFTSLYNNLGIAGNEGSELSFKSYIPALAIIDYDGIYIYSAEEDSEGNIDYVLKPKKYFTYMYYIDKNDKNRVKEYTAESNINDVNAGLIYQVTFTQDDYVYLKIYQHISGTIKEYPADYLNAFYLEDNLNNGALIGDLSALQNLGGGILSEDFSGAVNSVVEELKSKRKEVIAKICMQELSYAVNAHNYYAQKAGVRYNFNFGIISDADWYETVDGIGMIAVVQGISLGNRYLNYSAYGLTDLTVAKKYYLSNALGQIRNVVEDSVEKNYYDDEENNKFVALGDYHYYHSREDCPLYTLYLEQIENKGLDKIVPSFLYNKEEAAANGYKPCFVCKP